MASFDEMDWGALLPPYLTDPHKERLKKALDQFRASERATRTIDYSHFFLVDTSEYFKQGDLIFDVRFADWNEETTQFEKKYVNAIILTNTCDISDENSREVNNKQCLFAPLIELDDYIEQLKANSYSEDQVKGFISSIKNQTISNIFYIPTTPKVCKDYIAFFDQMFWFPTSELNDLLPTIESEKIASLSNFGFYLLILKLSYHLCRLPEQLDRKVETIS